MPPGSVLSIISLPSILDSIFHLFDLLFPPSYWMYIYNICHHFKNQAFKVKLSFHTSSFILFFITIVILFLILLSFQSPIISSHPISCASSVFKTHSSSASMAPTIIFIIWIIQQSTTLLMCHYQLLSNLSLKNGILSIV